MTTHRDLAQARGGLRDRARTATLTAAVRLHGRVTGRVRAAGPRDRGDVPGWVLVTLMTAALVVALLTLARPLLESLFQNAVNEVDNT